MNQKLAPLFLIAVAWPIGGTVLGSGALPGWFSENRGQAPAGVRFLLHGTALSARFEADRVQLQTSAAAVQIQYLGASRSVVIEGTERSTATATFLIGEKDRWRSDVPLYSALRYRHLYPGIDLIFRGHGSALKSEFRVAPGADPGQIRFCYLKATSVMVARRSGLSVKTDAGELYEQAPETYQEIGRKRIEITGRFHQNQDGTIGFQIGHYDKRAPLIIDPVMTFSTYWGGSLGGVPTAIAVDRSGAVYVAGYTPSIDLPIASPMQSQNQGSNDAFIAKLAAGGKQLIYCTYLGGSGDDRAMGIAVDSSGASYVTGSTSSANFPLRNPLQPRLAGSKNAFVSKLAPSGNALVYSTYLGGNGVDGGNGIAVDTDGNAYIVGDTTSATFPSNGFQRSNFGFQDAFVAALNSSGTKLIYSTFLGGHNKDHGAAIAIDSKGQAYVTGSTFSTDFPTQMPFQPSNAGGQDAFVTKLSADGTALVFSTYVGGSGGTASYPETGQAIAVDLQGNAFITGTTSSANFPVVNPAQSTRDGWLDAFVLKFSSVGTLVYSTYMGGSGIEVGNAIAVDGSDNVYVAGYTNSTDLPVVNSFQNTNAGDYDAFIAELNATGNSAPFLSYLGGEGADAVNAIALDAAGDVYLAGQTQSASFPLRGAVLPSTGSNSSGFIAELAFGPAGGETTIWDASTAPGMPWHSDSGMTAGVKFRSDVAGSISGIRFYKGAGNNGTHIGLLYTSFGGLLAQATFTGESTSGWQQVNFSYPVSISANTTYVAAYFSSTGFAYNSGYFRNSGVDNAPLHALRSGVDGPNGLYFYSNSPQFPTQTYGDANYWVDVAFTSDGGVALTPDLNLTLSHSGVFVQGQAGETYTLTVANGGTGATSGAVSIAVTLPGGLTATSIAGADWNCTQPSGPCMRSDVLPAGGSYPPLTLTVNVATNAAASLTTTATVSGGGQSNTSNDCATDVTVVTSIGGQSTASIWSSSVTPGIAWHADSGMTAGVKFRSDVAGTITGIRFYKGSGNNGTHIGLLYTSSGTLLGQATFTGESSSGWQQVNFSNPIFISANTIYVAAYFSSTGFAYDSGYFTNAGMDNWPLHALRSGVDGPNGLYCYAGSPQFPTQTYGDSNYWVDVAFAASGSLSLVPDLSVSVSHSGAFSQGQAGAKYAVTVTNVGSGPTRGAVSVEVALPTGLTATSISGTNWTCTQPGGPCTRNDVAPAGSSYPALKLTVDVAGNAPGSVTSTAIVSGGGETDTANDQGSDLTTITSSGERSTASIWDTVVTPGTLWHCDSAMTAGLKFRSDVAGAITGIRFYKGAGNNGTHIGMLYTAAGVLLAQATFTGESAAGWQQINFSSPVSIYANTTYVAAYFSSTGFAYDSGYFTNKGVDNSPLHALQSGADGPNGLYWYGNSVEFPTQTYGDANYWVDVVFAR